MKTPNLTSPVSSRHLLPAGWASFLLRVTIVILISGFSSNLIAQTEALSFNRDIRPILSDKCFHCHGPDENSREADLRLDTRETAFNVIEPGSLEDSELFHRIVADDEDTRMPPAEVNKPLTPDEIKILKTWIEQGAAWSDFWAYVPPRRHPVPKPVTGDYENWIDAFVADRLTTNQLTLSPPADKTTLIRRLYFDLVGLPPTPDQLKDFIEDDSPQAVEKVVDELLASPHFGERLAIYWLDLVRYADTVGYHGDQTHNISPYRDWVINAFNQNMPFDQFTREQLAGDLLPNPTQSQRIASGYNRLLQTTHEGGLQPKEYTAIYAADRVRNVSLVWMGATVGCAQCHDHKYDPYTAKDFYSLAAFFADIDDEKHFTAGSNALPTKRPPEILVIDDDSKAELKEISNQVAEHKAVSADLKRKIAELQRQIERPENQPDGQTAPTVLTPEELSDLKLELANLQASEKQHANSLKKLDATREKVENRGAWTMISQPLPKPRITRVLPRGNWLDDSGPVVQPAIPEFMGTLKSDQRATRLDLADWLTDPESGNGKLTARVFANRFWYLFMGVGISKSLDDFGGQGEAPAAPELLDNLATEFVQNGWDVKQLIRQIVTSQTYQQSSLETNRIRAMDPYNQLFSHQSRFRLPAEIVRDNALAIAGLLNLDHVGGKSIKPAQPAGYYQHLNFPARKYQQDHDPRQWRRGVYVHWQRMFLHPSMKAFDAPSREECTAVRPRSNTPSAALALLNDPIFVEAAKVFAERIVKETASDIFNERLSTAFQIALSRDPEPEEVSLLGELYDASLEDFRNDPVATTDLLAIGDAETDTSIDPVELASWTTIARAILNMNETVTRN